MVNKYIKIYRYLLYIKTIDAIALAELFFEEVIFRYGMLTGIVFNRGSVFTSKF